MHTTIIVVITLGIERYFQRYSPSMAHADCPPNVHDVAPGTGLGGIERPRRAEGLAVCEGDDDLD